MLLEAGLLHGDCMTITGKTIAETLAEMPAAPRADQDVIRPIGQPMYAQGHLAILKGNLSPEGAVAKITGLKNPVDHRPGARVRRRAVGDGGDHRPAHRRRRRDGAALPRAQGRARHAGDAGADRRADRPGPRRVASAWSPTGASPAAPGAWWSATSRPRPTPAARSRWCEEGDSITIDAHTLLLQLNVDDAEIARRRAALGGAEAALHARRAGEVREERLERQPRRGARRRLS